MLVLARTRSGSVFEKVSASNIHITTILICILYKVVVSRQNLQSVQQSGRGGAGWPLATKGGEEREGEGREGGGEERGFRIISTANFTTLLSVGQHLD